ncbi:hypothetical protein PanWU01x14_259270 [Parasponia andersonii]|uniref:Pollen Ole e 1 allergen and extensin family protein n=1 Tax=Parasponia andersonii TaxID=3476 RepID=A0A2P5B9D1_PARAD|nr:hypothetical protein PanWU01x14_259270 [Parasponia andersonii]
MASKSGLFLALLLVATAATVANSFFLNLNGVIKNVNGLKFVGTLSHPRLPATCASGVAIEILNIVDHTVLCSGVTNELGAFELIAVNLDPEFVFVPTNYVVSTVLPITGCDGFTDTGVLFQASVGVVEFVLGTLFGLLGQLLGVFTCGNVFSLVPYL